VLAADEGAEDDDDAEDDEGTGVDAAGGDAEQAAVSPSESRRPAARTVGEITPRVFPVRL
jgi:hypothetical protein